jgi:uncharacterized membrane protein YpjA
MMKKVGFGLILWVIPYVTAIPLLGLMQSDLILFKTIMIVEGAIVGAVLTVLHFLDVKRDFLREGIVLAFVWIVLNWSLDFLALLPFTNLTVPRYFLEIGLRYLAIVAPTVAVGYVLERRISGSATSVE